jgi:hypothetical protein
LTDRKRRIAWRLSVTMGVKLDWDIGNEAVFDGAGEHPEALRQRRRAQRRTLTVILAGVLLVAGVVGGVLARLWYVDTEIERQLRDTVAAETAALRIGDIAAYLNVQRSASDAWMLGQTDRFWQYGCWWKKSSTASASSSSGSTGASRMVGGTSRAM